MIVTRLSPSAYNKWDECQNAYYIDYVLKWRTAVGKAADKGTIVHAVLEMLAKAKLQHQQGKDICIEHESLGEPLCASDLWDFDIPALVYNTYDWYTTTKFSHQDWKNQDLVECQKWTGMVVDGPYDPRNKNVWSTEQYFKIPLNKDWATYEHVNEDGSTERRPLSVTGIIDVVYYHDDINCLESNDYKTGRQRKCFITGKEKDYDALMKDPQLRIYHWAMKKLYPEREHFLISIYYMRVDESPITLTFSDKDYEETEDMIYARFKDIIDTQIPVLNKSWRCKRFCPFGKQSFSEEEHGIKPMIEYRVGQLNKPGEKMCMCSQVNLKVHKIGIDKVTEEYGNKNSKR